MVVCIFQAYDILSSTEVKDKTSGYLFIGVGLFAMMRYIMLRRRQFLDKKKDGKFG